MTSKRLFCSKYAHVFNGLQAHFSGLTTSIKHVITNRLQPSIPAFLQCVADYELNDFSGDFLPIGMWRRPPQGGFPTNA
jgi:hypothetical protein